MNYFKQADFSLFSIAMYSSWCHYKPINALFDCGEGFTLFYRNCVFAIENIFLSHEHGDHTGSLLSLFAARASARGDKEKPLRVFYPASTKLDSLKAFSRTITNAPIEWYPISPGQIIGFSGHFKVIPFKTNHTSTSVGYRVMERRYRLPKALQGLSGEELRKMPSAEKKEEYWHPKFVYALDNCGADWGGCEGADLMIQDATFLKGEDRDALTHNTIVEAMKISLGLGVKKTILTHVSPRYGKLEKDHWRDLLSKKFELI